MELLTCFLNNLKDAIQNPVYNNNKKSTTKK